MLRSIISKEGKLLDPKKIQTIVNMHMPINPQQIQKLNGMAQCFYKITFNMVLIIKLM